MWLLQTETNEIFRMRATSQEAHRLANVRSPRRMELPAATDRSVLVCVRLSSVVRSENSVRVFAHAAAAPS